MAQTASRGEGGEGKREGRVPPSNEEGGKSTEECRREPCLVPRAPVSCLHSPTIGSSGPNPLRSPGITAGGVRPEGVAIIRSLAQLSQFAATALLHSARSLVRLWVVLSPTHWAKRWACLRYEQGSRCCRLLVLHGWCCVAWLVLHDCMLVFHVCVCTCLRDAQAFSCIEFEGLGSGH